MSRGVDPARRHLSPRRAGRYVPAEEWVLPDITEIPYAAYGALYASDRRKFCGIPDREELVVEIARGYPVGCDFCDVPVMQGRAERRISPARTLDYVVDAFGRHAFEYYSFYCPTFTLDRSWVRRFYTMAIERGVLHPWKCVTAAALVDEETLALMARSGCVRVSIGLETLDPTASSRLPSLKREAEHQLERLAPLCKAHGIELNCFVILGLPGDSPESARYTIRRVLECGARVRPTVFTPFDALDESMEHGTVAQFNRQLFIDGLFDPAIEQQYYQLYFDNPMDADTRVMDRIPRVRERPRLGADSPPAAGPGE